MKNNPTARSFSPDLLPKQEANNCLISEERNQNWDLDQVEIQGENRDEDHDEHSMINCEGAAHGSWHGCVNIERFVREISLTKNSEKEKGFLNDP
ncbi:hypothetical protein EVAR_54_1 [Eumeta japonica]|uniref:Uncharacterized protein n=1 Tax=Eumeta variegata TaxID=151549 RepID=A0A4C1S7Y4_EUMVA|nr:hypothetical protein EVAR_54_1 [Eumeta japonica]